MKEELLTSSVFFVTPHKIVVLRGCDFFGLLHRQQRLGAPFKPDFVFSSMTSFTKRLQTSFTLRRERSERRRAKRNGLEDDGYTAAAGGVCGVSGAQGKAF
jgi:hypothetical protein